MLCQLSYTHHHCDNFRSQEDCREVARRLFASLLTSLVSVSFLRNTRRSSSVANGRPRTEHKPTYPALEHLVPATLDTQRKEPRNHPGAPEGTRTPDPRLRRPLLCPPELLARIGASRFERPTPCSQGRCATRLRHAPNVFDQLSIASFAQAVRESTWR